MESLARYLIVASLLFVYGCSSYPHEVKRGDLVRVTLDARVCTVLATRQFRDLVVVRCAANSDYAPLLGGKVTSSPYSIVRFHDWEIERVPKREYR